MDLKDLPKALRMKKLAWLKTERARGVPLSTFSQEERDLLHMETSEENLRYWRAENELADDEKRWKMCQDIIINIAANLSAQEPSVDDEHPLAHILCGALEEADRLPAVH